MQSKSAVAAFRRLNGQPIESPSHQEQGAAETFRLEVSAGKNIATGHGPLTIPTSVQASVDRVSVSNRRPIYCRRIGRKSVRQVNRSPAWWGSLLAHGGLLTALATFTIPGLPQAFDFTLSLSNEPVLADEAAIDDFAVDPLEMLDSIDGLVLPEVAPVSAELAGLDESSLLTDAAHFATAIALDSAADLLASADANAGTSLPSGEDLTASFFGTKVEGRRILYVLDNSGGMRKGGLEVLIDELVRSVDTLTPQQKFYVIFYSDSVYPLFHPSPANEFVPANDRIKARLQKWLEKVELSVGNSVDEAIQMAAEIQPDAVYLLTDGNVNTTDDGRKLAALLDRRDREFPIHTFLIGMGPNSKAAENLRLVAQANNGTFRAVEVTPEASARAKQKNRPYHNKEPGKVWGRNVGRGWGR